MKSFEARLRYRFPRLFGTKKPRPIGHGHPMLTGYGRVNKWASGSEEALKKDLIECAKHGVAIYHIEYAGWADFWTNEATRRKTRERYKSLLAHCRALGLWLFVGIVNDNMGRNKYGDTGPALSAVYGLAQQELQFIKSCGKDNVLVQPVAETQTSAGKRFDAEVVATLQGWQTVYNGDGGRPSSTHGCAFLATHPESVAAVSKSPVGSVVSSDHGLLIRELGHGLDGAGKPDQLRAFVAAARKRNAAACVYYAFLHAEHDREAIRAMKP